MLIQLNMCQIWGEYLEGGGFNHQVCVNYQGLNECFLKIQKAYNEGAPFKDSMFNSWSVCNDA